MTLATKKIGEIIRNGNFFEWSEKRRLNKIE
jgi:hypothetical protein